MRRVRIVLAFAVGLLVTLASLAPAPALRADAIDDVNHDAVVGGLSALAQFPAPGVAPVVDGEPPGVLISRQLAEAQGITVGEVVRIGANPAGAGARAFRVIGVYEPTPDPLRFASQRLEARLHLPDLLSLTSDGSDPQAAESVSAINVAVTRPEDAETFARDVVSRIPGAAARTTSAPDDRTNTFVVVERFHLAIAIVTVVGSAIFLLALMVMLVDERRETVGTLRIIGLSRARILSQVFVEGAMIAVAGAIFGVLFAVAMQAGFNRFFQWRYDTALVFVRITPRVAGQCVLLAVPLGVLASLLASWSLVRQGALALVRR